MILENGIFLWKDLDGNTYQTEPIEKPAQPINTGRNPQ